ncbi:Putative uncharacterized protein [Lactobacillus gigeriorum DSM 23908 = CRBIP 24.85]|uniref:Gram-positive cocci surface proteins LPxTG domain-containing protein n=4 Tax=Lactobacillus TaxID=1578 RepID=I7LGF7_9LACO|nr:Putative uncharacterized protein [Lactobacillus gigeriorum DSM 23908 = CRBIP 24.85]
MDSMFDHNQISDLSPLANWNIGKVTNMSSMFADNRISDLSPLADWNTGKVTYMGSMFDHNQISDLSSLAGWNTGNVTIMESMFDHNQISDLRPLAGWNTGNVTYMDSMFDHNQISDLRPLANWNTGKVTHIDSMFADNQISDLSPLANWNTDKVTDMKKMFYNNRISDLSPLANWNTGKVTDMSYMFANNRISDLSPLANWNTGKVTDMSYMFYNNRISDLSPLANWNTGKVTDMSLMFANNRISDLSPLANWNTSKVTNMDSMFYDPLDSTINSQSTLNKFHAIAYKLDNTGALTSHSESKTFNDGLQVLLDKNIVTNENSATLIFKANSSAGNTYQIKIYNPNGSIDIQADPLQTALGTTNISTFYQDGYTIITNKFINNGSVTQRIYIRPNFKYYDFAPYESTSGLITVVKDKEDLGSINITYQNVSGIGIGNDISAPYIDGNKPYINHTQNTFYFKPQVHYYFGSISYYNLIKSAGLTITVPDDVTIDPDTFIDNATGKTLKATKIADNQYQVVLNDTTDEVAVKGLINVPADKLTNGFVDLPGFGMKYTINTYNDKAEPLVATGTSKELFIVPDWASYHSKFHVKLININQSKWAFDRNGNKVYTYTSQGFNNGFTGSLFEPALSTQVTNGVETFDMPTGVNITEFRVPTNGKIDHIDYIFTDGSKQTTSSLDKTSKAIRQMKVYFKNGIQSNKLFGEYFYFDLSFDDTYPDGRPIKAPHIFNITGSFSCNELGSTGKVNVVQVMLAPTQKLTDGMLTDTSQNELSTASNGNFIAATILNDGREHQGHLTNPIFYFKYNNLMVPDLSKISASYNNQNKELGSIGLTNIDKAKIHSSIITDSNGQRFIKVKVDGEYYYGGSSDRKSDFNVQIPISNLPDALAATKDWSWYILNNSDKEKTKSTIRNSSQSNRLDPVTVDGNTLSVGGTGTWRINVAQSFTSSTETQGNLNGGPGLVSTQDDHHQDPTHFYIYDSIINATNDAKSDLVSVVNLPSTQDGKSEFDVHMTGEASLINVMTGQAYDATITYSYYTGDNKFITGDQVKNDNGWSKVKSIKVVPNGGAPSMTSLRLVIPVEDEYVYDHVGKTIYVSTMTYGEDKTNTNYTTKYGFAVPDGSTILPIIIKPGDTGSAKLTVQGQATVHTLIHYKDESGKEVYVKLVDQDKIYNELQDTMKRSDYLQSDNDLTIADRGLLPTGMVINYGNPTIRNSNNNYVNNEDVFDKMAKYDFDGDQVIFEGAMPEVVTQTHQVKETIHYVYSDGSPAAPDKVLTSVALKQTSYKNPFTGEITWNASTTDTLNSVDSPEITGYTPDKSSIERQTFKFGDKDVEVTVTYSANAQTATITYIDDTEKKTLGSDKQNGKFNQVITFEHDPAEVIKGLEEKGYKLVSNDFKSGIKYQNDNKFNNFEVHLKHGTENVSRNDDVNMTVHYVMDDGSEAPNDNKQTVNFTENGTQDLVTKNITWTPAESQTLKDVDSPVLIGYTADIKTASGKVVNFGDLDINVTVHYSANAQTATITYIDDTEKKTLGSDKQNGKFNQVITFEHDPAEVIKGLEEKGYKLVSNDFKSGIKYQNDNKFNNFEVHLKHGTENVSRNDDVNMTVHYVMDDGSEAPNDNKQTVNFTENGTQDLVTKNITWTSAESQTLKDVDSPVLTGYTADIKTAKGKVVNFDDPDINVTVHYSANEQTATITYIDDTTKNNLDSKVAKGKFNQVITFATAPTDEIANYEKQGYKLVSNDFNNQKYQADNNNNVFYVHLKRGTTTDNPGSNGGGDQGTTPTPEPVPEPTPSPDDQPDTTLPSDNNTDKDVEKDKQDKPEEMKKARKIIKTRITKQEHIGNAEKAEHLTEQEHNDQTVVSPVKNEANEPQLPQTGEANTSVIGLLGMLVAGFAAILGFESSRSRKHKN